MSSDYLLKDPFEKKTATVRNSTIAGAGEGVFLVRDVKKNTIVSYFNGIRMKEKDVFTTYHMFQPKSVYLVEIGEEDDFLDVLPEAADWNVYQASTGHKVNHAKVANAGYTECEHPRFGLILCLQTYEDLKAGTELFTKYDVAFDKQGMKNVLKKALDLGHMVSGKSKSQFVKDVKPYLKAASKMAEKIELEDIISFGTK